MKFNQENYDIINELGPKNRFDVLAGEAQIAGYRYKDRVLINMGTELGKLIREIPYTSDKYYLLHAKASEIEERIKALEGEKIGAKEGVLSDYYFESIYYPESECWKISMGVMRAKSKLPVNVTEGVFREKILQWMESRGSIEKKEGLNSTSLWYKERRMWTDGQGRMIFSYQLYNHDNQEDVGLAETFYFYGQDGDVAKKFWNEIKAHVSSLETGN